MAEQWEEVPGSRTTQPTQILAPKTDEIAYRDLRPGEMIQAGDEWQAKDGTGVWSTYHAGMHGSKVLDASKARRPYNITELLMQRDQAAHEYRLYREALEREQAAHRATTARSLQMLEGRGNAEQALKMARQSLEETRAAREVLIAERNEAERLLTEERDTHAQTSSDRARLSLELNECQQQRQHLQTALEELQRRRDAAEIEAQVNALTVGEVVNNILSALEIASHALEYLADVGVNEEAGHYCGFSAAVAVVKKIKESAR